MKKYNVKIFYQDVNNKKNYKIYLVFIYFSINYNKRN